MNKKLFALLLTIICIMSTGCSLAAEGTKEAGDVPVTEDQLVGMLITMDHFLESTEEAYIQMPLWNAQTSGMEDPLHYASNQGKRLYAAVADREYPTQEGTYTSKVYEFPEGTGIAHMAFLVRENGEDESYWSGNTSEEISDVKRHFITTDGVSSIELSGTIYVSTEASDLALYLNPVYQTKDGEVYALGTYPMGYQAVSMGGTTETTTQEINASIGEIETSGSTVSLTIEVIDLPEKYLILEMSEDNQVLKTTEFVPEEMPERYVPQIGTAYLVLEAHSGEGVARTVYSPSDTSKRMESFYPGDFGICIKGYTEIEWEAEK